MSHQPQQPYPIVAPLPTQSRRSISVVLAWLGLAAMATLHAHAAGVPATPTTHHAPFDEVQW